MKKWIFTLPILFFTHLLLAQSGFAFGIKGGGTFGTQRWNNGGGTNFPLFAYHGITFIESTPEDDSNILYAQLGYHIRGSAERFNTGSWYNPSTGKLENLKPFTNRYEYRNLSLGVGAKKKKPMNRDDMKWYYMFGIRGEYTINTNLPSVSNNSGVFLGFSRPVDEYVRKINYGMTFGGGIEWKFKELVGSMLEFTINPDFSRQYFLGSVPNLIDPFTGQRYNSSEVSIRNLTFELTLGLRFLRKVEIIE